MPKFIYVGGRTKTEHFSEMDNGRGGSIIVDERQGVDLPDTTFAFGHKFIVGQPVDLKREAFPSEQHFRHVLTKLEKHPHFKSFAEDVPVVMVQDEPAPPVMRRKPGPKQKLPPEIPVNVHSQDADE